MSSAECVQAAREKLAGARAEAEGLRRQAREVNRQIDSARGREDYVSVQRLERERDELVLKIVRLEGRGEVAKGERSVARAEGQRRAEALAAYGPIARRLIEVGEAFAEALELEHAVRVRSGLRSDDMLRGPPSHRQLRDWLGLARKKYASITRND